MSKPAQNTSEAAMDLEEGLDKYRRAASDRIRKQTTQAPAQRRTPQRRQGTHRSRVAQWLSDPKSLRTAWVLKEILGPPKGL